MVKTKYRITPRNHQQSFFADEEKVRECLKGVKDMDKAIENLDKGYLLKTKNYYLRLAI